MDNLESFEDNNFKFEEPQEKFRYSDSNGFRFSNNSNMKFNMDDYDSNCSFVFENFKADTDNQNSDTKHECLFPVKNSNLDDSSKERFTEFNRENPKSQSNYFISFDQNKHNEKSFNKSGSLEVNFRHKKLSFEPYNETSIESIIEILVTFQTNLTESKIIEILNLITNISKIKIKDNASPSYIRFIREMIFISEILSEAQIILNIINDNDFNIDNYTNNIKLSYNFFLLSLYANSFSSIKNSSNMNSNLNEYMNPLNLIILWELNEKNKGKVDSMYLCSINYQIYKKIAAFRKILMEKLFVERIYFEFLKKIVFYIDFVKESFILELQNARMKSVNNNCFVQMKNSKKNTENDTEKLNVTSECKKELKFYLSNFKCEIIFAILSYLQESCITNFDTFLKYYYSKFNLFKSNAIISYTKFFDHFYQINVADFSDKLIIKNKYKVIKEKIIIDKSFLNTQKISFRQKKRNILQFNKYQEYLNLENIDIIQIFIDIPNIEHSKTHILNHSYSQYNDNDLNLLNIKDSKLEKFEQSNFIDNSDLNRFSINSMKSDFYAFRIKSKESNTTIKKKQAENAFFENFNNLSINDDIIQQSYLDFQLKNDINNSMISKLNSNSISILKNINTNDEVKEYKIEFVNPNFINLRLKRKKLTDNISESCINDTINTNLNFNEKIKNNSRMVNSKILSSSSIILNPNKRSYLRKTRNHLKNPNLNKLKEFNFEFGKRENVDKKIIRKFRKFVQDKYFKNLKLTRKKSQFYDLMNQFLNKCLFPPCKTYDNLIFKSFSYGYLSWLFSHRIIQLLFKKYIKSNMQNLTKYLCEIFSIENSQDIEKLKNYLENYIDIYNSLSNSNNQNNNLVLNSSRSKQSKQEISEINPSCFTGNNIKNDTFEQDSQINIFDESAEINYLLNKYTNKC